MIRTAALALLLTGSLTAFAADSSPATPDLAKAKQTAETVCAACHGPDGNAPIDASYPKLGGQYADYLAHALQQYRKGEREHALMTPQASGLGDQDIADLAAYFGSRPGQLRDLSGAP